MARRFRTVLLTLLISVMPVAAQEPLEDMIARGLSRSATQALILAKSLKDKPAALPRTWENGELKTTSYSGWVSGFFPGVLWMMYDETGDNRYRYYAEMYTSRVEPAKKITNNHDVGFMLMSSFGRGYRLTGNPHYLEVIHEGTDSLMTRWNPFLGVMKSWEENNRWKFPVIIDNMMNLEMLCFSTKMFGDTQIVFILLLPLKCLFFMPFMEFGVIYRERLEHVMSKLNTGGNMILLIALLLLNVIRMMCLPQPDDITLDSLYYLGGFTSPYYITPIISSLIGIMFWVTVVDAIGNVFAENRIVNCISENITRISKITANSGIRTLFANSIPFFTPFAVKNIHMNKNARVNTQG